MTQPVAVRRLVAASAFALAPSIAAFAQSVPPAASPARASGGAPAAAALKTLNLEEYGRFNRIAATALSPDGKWMTYTVTPNDGTGTLYIKQLEGGEKVVTLPRGSGVQFNETSRFAAYFVDPPTGGRGGGGRGGAPGNGGRGRGATPPAQQAPAADAGQAPARSFVIMDLQAGTTETVPGVGSFSF